MSTIASPRPSISASSRRTSASTDPTSTAQASSVERGSLRRNRVALRDYYNLKTGDDTPTSPSVDVEYEHEVDAASFHTPTYISNLLAREGLDGLLKVEAGLISDIRSLDGEKKALVYDNYSKLIAATDTIRSMREKMGPLTPTTNTLTPAIGHIAETAASLSSELRKSYAQSAKSGDAEVLEGGMQDKQQTVRWVLAAPERLAVMVGDGQQNEAQAEWQVVKGLLDKWGGVKGADDVREGCLKALQGNG